MSERRHIKHDHSLDERLADQARRLKDQARVLPHGAAREMLLRKARQAETAAHMTEWLTSPGLRPPE